jgi:ribonuclease HI
MNRAERRRGKWAKLNPSLDYDALANSATTAARSRCSCCASWSGLTRPSTPDEPVAIRCDSKYVVDGCNVWRHGWKAKGWRRMGDKASPEKQAIANLDLWKAIDVALDPLKQVQIL